LIKQYLINLG
jgi:hypothetical protein